MNKSIFAILLVLIACQNVLGQWSSFDALPDGSISSIIQLQRPKNSDSLFAICTNEEANRRQLCRVTLSAERSWSISPITPFAAINNFAAVTSPTNNQDVFITGGLTAPVVDSRANNGLITSSFSYQTSTNNFTFAPQYFGTVVASAIDFMVVNQDYVPMQYHLAYSVDRSTNIFTWLVQRVVAERSDLDHQWTINNFIPANCSVHFTTGSTRTTISTANNGSKILSIGLVGNEPGCSGLYQFTLPTTTASNDLTPLRSMPFSSTAMTINSDVMYYFGAVQLCRLPLSDPTNPRCVSVTRLGATQMDVSENRLFVAYSMSWIEIYDLDLQSTELNRYLPINVTADSLAVMKSTILMTYRGIREGRPVALGASTIISSSFLTYQQLQEASVQTVPTLYGADVVVGLAVGLAIAGVLAIVGWALFLVLRKNAGTHVKTDAYLMLNEKLSK